MPIGFNSDTQVGLYLPGNVVQTQNSVNSFSQTNTTAGVYSDVNQAVGVPWETLITPRYSNSKIIVMYSMNFYISASGASTYGGFAFARKIGSGTYTTIHESTRDNNGPYQYGQSGGGVSSQAHYTQGFLIFVDQPNTTSTCAYKIMGRPYASGYTLGTNLTGGQFTGSSYCVLQEVQQ